MLHGLVVMNDVLFCFSLEPLGGKQIGLHWPKRIHKGNKVGLEEKPGSSKKALLMSSFPKSTVPTLWITGLAVISKPQRVKEQTTNLENIQATPTAQLQKNK